MINHTIMIKKCGFAIFNNYGWLMHTRFKFVPVARTNVVEDEDKRTGVDRRADNPTCMNSRSSKFCG